MDLRRALPVLRDLVGVAGAGAIVVGVDLISEPAAFIVGGIIAVAAAVLLSLKED